MSININEDMNFEQTIEKLEEIAELLEKGDLNLDDSVEKFEEGMQLSKKCSEYLEKAEKKINILIENNGKIKEEKFEN